MHGNILNILLEEQDNLLGNLLCIDVDIDKINTDEIYYYLLGLNEIIKSISFFGETINKKLLNKLQSNHINIIDRIVYLYSNDKIKDFNINRLKINTLLSKAINFDFKNNNDELIQDNKWVLENKNLTIEEMRHKLLNSHDEFCKFMFNELEGKYIPTLFDKIFNDTI
ncbi:MAG: hypothetical protein KAU90_09495, partial [Sulfurovaceae bacterium]|nr:hypothetical protein [Sulfurovaceae bacterium]